MWRSVARASLSSSRRRPFASSKQPEASVHSRPVGHIRNVSQLILPGSLVGSKTLRGKVSSYPEVAINNWSKPFSSDSGNSVDAVVSFMGESVADVHGDRVEADDTIAKIGTDKVTTDPNDVESAHDIVGLTSGLTFAENAQVDPSASGTEIRGILDHFSADFNENGDDEVGSVASEGEEEIVHVIDVQKLEDVLSLLQSSVDGSLWLNLDDMGLVLDEEFVVRVLETPFIVGENLIDFYRWASSKENFEVTAPIIDALVSAICGCPRVRDSYTLWDLIKVIGAKKIEVLNAETLNKLIALFAQFGKGKVAFEVFNKFEEFGCVRNADTYYSTIEALCKRSIFDWASSVCESMLNDGIIPESEKVGKIISWLCKGKKVKDAYLVYLLAKEQNKYPPQSSINFLIGSLCCEDENVKSALEILDDFSGDTKKYAIKPFSAVVSGLCRIKDMNGAKKLLVKMIAEGPPPGNAVFNSIISGYSKAGKMGKAEEIMGMMKSRGLRPDVYAYTVVISGYVKGGELEKARTLLSEAKKKHSKVSPVTYHTLIRGYCKVEDFGSALKLLGEMKKYGIQPNVDEYTKLIQSLCLKALDWKTAEKLLKEMEEKGLFLNGITRGLIVAVKDLEEEVQQVTAES